jgi:pimeloyl-ACP methyl ester carboxylesterase
MQRLYREERLLTSDGFELGLFHSASPSDSDVDRRPVLLLHGAAANHLGFGLVPGAQLARALNAQGRDAWLLDFRGTRSSRWLGRGRPPLELIHKLEIDLPAAIRRVLEATGSRELDLVGHSIGGTFSYYIMGGPLGSRVARAVTLCAPATFGGLLGRQSRALALPLRVAEKLSRRLRGFGIDRLARVPGPIPHAVALVQHMRLGTSGAGVRRAWLNHAIEDMSGTDLGELCAWIRQGYLPHPAGGRYEDLCARVTQPVLAIAAARDPLVPPRIVEAGLRSLGSGDKRFVLVGRQHGATRDYAHADLLVAPSAARDVYPSILAWLSAGSREPSSEAAMLNRGSPGCAR